MSLQELGGYSIGKVFAGGTYAVLYAVQDTDTLLVKVLPEHLIDEASYKSRFENHLELVSQLTHPNILPLHDYGIDGAYSYLVFPRQLQSLEDTHSTAPLSPKRTLNLLKPIADALDFIHEQGFVHGDVKPSNILVSKDKTPLLADVGLHHILQETATLLEVDDIVGTPPYLAPEQARSGKSSVEADVYALAAVAYECLTGQKPTSATIQQPSDLPEAAQSVLRKALHPQPSRRYRSALQFIETLGVGLLGTPATPIPTDEHAEAIAPMHPKRSRLRRLGCGFALAVWFVLMLWPCVLITVLIEGEFVVGLSDRPGHEVRMFNVESEDSRGFGFSVAEIAEETDDLLCVKTYVRYVIWRGENEPVDYCRCYEYELQSSDWQATRAVNASCEPLQTPETQSFIYNLGLQRR